MPFNCFAIPWLGRGYHPQPWLWVITALQLMESIMRLICSSWWLTWVNKLRVDTRAGLQTQCLPSLPVKFVGIELIWGKFKSKLIASKLLSSVYHPDVCYRRPSMVASMIQQTVVIVKY